MDAWVALPIPGGVVPAALTPLSELEDLTMENKSIVEKLRNFEEQAVSPRDKALRLEAAQTIEMLEHNSKYALEDRMTLIDQLKAVRNDYEKSLDAFAEMAKKYKELEEKYLALTPPLPANHIAPTLIEPEKKVFDFRDLPTDTVLIDNSGQLFHMVGVCQNGLLSLYPGGTNSITHRSLSKKPPMVYSVLEKFKLAPQEYQPIIPWLDISESPLPEGIIVQYWMLDGESYKEPASNLTWDLPFDVSSRIIAYKIVGLADDYEYPSDSKPVTNQ